MTHIAFIGGGNMARSLIGGLIARGEDRRRIRVSEPMPELRAALVRDFDVEATADNVAAAYAAEVVVLAVKPQVMAEVCRGLADTVRANRALVISIAAGISLSNFGRWLGSDTALVRAMPNTPALISEGASGLFANDATSTAQRALAERILGAVGSTCWIADEALMDAVTAVSGSGPAYYFLLMESMIAAAERQGLPNDIARQLVLQTALGAARMALEGHEPPDVLRQRVTSPNGTTQAALEVFEAGQFRALTDRAITRATERGRELSAQFGA